MFSAVKQPSITKSDDLDYNFVGPLDSKYQCLICTSILREPQLTECCGSHFCKTCLQKWEDSNKKKKCPHCRTENFAHILNKPLEREVNELKVYCHPQSKQLGCDWEGKLSQLDSHLKACDFVQIRCEKCNELILRKCSDTHLSMICRKREVNCQYCKVSGPYCDIFSLTHIFYCESYPVVCPNGCSGDSFPRSELKKHLEICPRAIVECPFSEMGCTEKIQRKDMDSHVSSSNTKHLMVMLDAFKKQSARIEHLMRFKEMMEGSIVEVKSEIDKMVTPGSFETKAQLTRIKQTLSAYPLIWLSAETNNRITLKLDQQSVVTIFATHAASRSFYVNSGYKFKVMCSVADIGMCSRANFKIVLLSGEYDHQLKWPPDIDLNSIILICQTVHFQLGSKLCNTLPSSKLDSGETLDICKFESTVVLTKVSDLSVTIQFDKHGTYDLVPSIFSLSLTERKTVPRKARIVRRRKI